LWKQLVLVMEGWKEMTSVGYRQETEDDQQMKECTLLEVALAKAVAASSMDQRPADTSLALVDTEMHAKDLALV
jgi:hypothetical protein